MVVLERELKLQADAAFTMPDLTVVPGVTAELGPPERLVALYYDTPNLRLAHWGVTLRDRDGVWTLKVPVGDGHHILNRHEVSFTGASGTPPPAAQDAVCALLAGEAMAPIATIATTRRIYRIRGGDGRGLGNLADDLVEVSRDGLVTSGFRQLELELAPGAEPRLRKAVARLLRAAGAQREPALPKLIQALGIDPAAGPEPRSPAVGPDATLQAAISAALAAGVRRLAGHDPGIRLDLDTEAVHQARAATRQLRATLAALRPALASPDRAASLRAELRWLGAALGAVRDPDVLGERLRAGMLQIAAPDAGGVGRLLSALAAERASARATLLAAMHEDRYAALLRDMAAFATAPDLVGGSEPARRALPSLVRRRWRRLTRSVADLRSSPEDADLHRIRIRAKDARYTAEAAAPVLGEPAERLARSLAELQSVLGRLQDATVAEAWLRRHGRRAGGTQALAAGQLIALARDDAADVRSEWRGYWAAAIERARQLGLKA